MAIQSSTASDRVAVVGRFGDVAPHHHPAVQISVGLDTHLHTAGGHVLRGPLLVVASGARHALHTGDSSAIAVYLRPDRAAGVRLNKLCRSQGTDGAWSVDIDPEFASKCREMLRNSGLDAAADMITAELDARAEESDTGAHPQLQRAIDLLASRTGSNPSDLTALARAVALSPDYLGRLFARQTGASFSSTARWYRLLSAFGHLNRGASITDAAHLAGFADGAHAARACRELTGAAPRDFRRALHR